MDNENSYVASKKRFVLTLPRLPSSGNAKANTIVLLYGPHHNLFVSVQRACSGIGRFEKVLIYIIV